MNCIQARFNSLLSHNSRSDCPPPLLTAQLASKLIDRLERMRLFAHAYPLLTNLTHGRVKPAELLDFAWRHELQGLSLHLLDGEANSLSNMNPQQLQEFSHKAATLGLDIHLEISSTRKEDVDQVIAIAKAIGTRNIRVYARYEGHLSRVMALIEEDLRYLAQQADLHDLFFDFEQHEELKSHEIAQLLSRLDHPRLHALFDFGNMINACEQPLTALKQLSAHIRQVHMKGVRVVPEKNGFGHYGVLQGGTEDHLPSARMMFELLMLGEQEPQVIAFILEQENHYAAPAFRQSDETQDPFIEYRQMSETALPPGFCAERMMAAEHQWANNQIRYVRGLLGELKVLAQLTLADTPVCA